MKTCKEDLFFDLGEKTLGIKEWQDAGEPITWYKVYDKDGIIIWDDRSYGYIRLQVGKDINDGTDIVVVNNVAVFGSCYSGLLKTFVPYITKE